jgi:hypothetical protein
VSYQDYQGQGPYQSRPTAGKATASLILGICGFVICPLIPSILAVVFGNQARAEIEESRGRLDGGGLATAGIVLGWIGIGLCAVAIAFVVVVIIVAAAGTRGTY